MPNIKIDGREIEVADGENLVDVGLRVGVHIPHFCYHPGLSVAGNCRQCLVEVEGIPKPQIACNLPIKDGMEIRTQTPEILEARRGVLEFLLLNHPIDCPICDQAGECRLQEYYMAHGLYDSRRDVDKAHKPKVVELGPHVLLDDERCVLCTRCVRFCEEVVGVQEIYVAERGWRSTIVTFPGKQLDNPYSANVVDICPVGALLNRDFRFKSRVWWLKQADSICSSCARGCNVRVDHHWNAIQRLVPRKNLEVNQYWMCDRGRFHIDWVNDNRLTEPEVPGLSEDRPPSLREAIDRVAAELQGTARKVTVVLSPKLCNEDLLVLRKVFAEGMGATVVGGSLEPPQEEDAILRKAEPHPNGWALRALKLEGDVAAAIRGAAGQALLLVGDDPVRWQPDLAAAIGGAAFVAAALTNDNATAAAVRAAGGVLLPLATHYEHAGSFTNFEGRVQRFEPALALYGSALPAFRYGTEFAHVLGYDLWSDGRRPENPYAAIWETLVPEDSGFPAVTWDAVPAEGLVPTWRPTAHPRSTMTPPEDAAEDVTLAKAERDA